MSTPSSSLDTLQSSVSCCRRCADAGYFIGSTPISTLNAGAIFMTVGQAPGRHEAEVTHKPFSGPAGKRLFRWLAQAGFDEAEFRATQAMVAITRCYPGPHPGGRGDRVPIPRRTGVMRTVAGTRDRADQPASAHPHRRAGDRQIPGQRYNHDRPDRRTLRAGWPHPRAAAASVRGQPVVQRAGEQGATGASVGDSGGVARRPA